MGLDDYLITTIDALTDGARRAIEIAEAVREHGENDLADKVMLFAEHDDDAICEIYK